MDSRVCLVLVLALHFMNNGQHPCVSKCHGIWTIFFCGSVCMCVDAHILFHARKSTQEEPKKPQKSWGYTLYWMHATLAHAYVYFYSPNSRLPGDKSNLNFSHATYLTFKARSAESRPKPHHMNSNLLLQLQIPQITHKGSEICRNDESMKKQMLQYSPEAVNRFSALLV